MLIMQHCAMSQCFLPFGTSPPVPRVKGSGSLFAGCFFDDCHASSGLEVSNTDGLENSATGLGLRVYGFRVCALRVEAVEGLGRFRAWSWGHGT